MPSMDEGLLQCLRQRRKLVTAHFAQNLVIGLLEDWKILEAERAKVIRDRWVRCVLGFSAWSSPWARAASRRLLDRFRKIARVPARVVSIEVLSDSSPQIKVVR